MSATDIEMRHVHEVYDTIATTFDATRVCWWNAVRQFLNGLPLRAMVLDNGCGNGKYQRFPRPDLCWFGSDMCLNLLKLAAHRHKDGTCDYLRANALRLPYKSATMDACICVAMLHHLSTEDRRRTCVAEMGRVLVPGGRLLLTVWADTGKASEASKASKASKAKGDQFIPWKAGETPMLRYYHLFTQEETMRLWDRHTWRLVNVSYECGNWVLELERLETSGLKG